MLKEMGQVRCTRLRENVKRSKLSFVTFRRNGLKFKKKLIFLFFVVLSKWLTTHPVLVWDCFSVELGTRDTHTKQ